MKSNLLILCLVGVLSASCVWGADEKSAPAAAQQSVRPQRVGVDEFDKLRANKENVVLDVRTEKEFKAGHIPGALNIDFKADNFDQQLGKLDKSKTYLVHCAGGVRSASASKKMEAMGFKSIFDLAPGFKGWEKAGKPVEK